MILVHVGKFVFVKFTFQVNISHILVMGGAVIARHSLCQSVARQIGRRSSYFGK
jgi:hypothetical protein